MWRRRAGTQTLLKPGPHNSHHRDTGGEGTPHMKGVGMLVGNFELNGARK